MSKLLWKFIAALAATSFLFSSAVTFAAPAFSVALDDLPVVGPFASWANVLSYGAKGDGVADDTAALQAALNDLGQPGKASVLFIPKGTYKISATLTYIGPVNAPSGNWFGVELIGENPASTKILWNGPQNGAMLIQNGGYNSRYSRITWEGNNSAGYGIAHWWNANAGIVEDASSEDTDEVFQNMGIGIMAGRMGANYGQLNSEGQVRRVTFKNITKAAVNTASWNSLDWWIWDSQFINCARGVSNIFGIDDNGPTSGAGNFMVYRSLFQGSTVADIDIANTQWFSMHKNVSIGSRRFFQAESLGSNDAHVIIQGNRIINTTDPVSIEDDNLGALILIDNQIRSANGQTTPAVRMGDWVGGRDIISLFNTYTSTATQPFAFSILTGNQPADRWLEIGDTTSALNSSIPTALPTMPSTPIWNPVWPVNQSSGVYEVAALSSCSSNAPAGQCATIIQSAINNAVNGTNSNPIVHLPSGNYYIDTPLVLPASRRIQFLGDSLTSALIWTNASSTGPMIMLSGPSLATIRDLQFYGNVNTPCGKAYAIGISNADQAGGRVFMEGSDMGPVQASNLQQTQLTMQANPSIQGLNFTNVMNAVSIGQILGPVSLTNSVALVEDSWYEGDISDLFRMTGSGFHYLGGMIAPATHPSDACSSPPTGSAIVLNDSTGNINFVGFEYAPGAPLLAPSPQTPQTASQPFAQITWPITQSYGLFMAGGSEAANYFPWAGPVSGGNVALSMSKTLTQGGVASLQDEGATSQSFIQSSLNHIRNLYWETPNNSYVATSGATDVRIYRVHAEQTMGLKINVP